MKTLKNDQHGSAHLLPILIVVVILIAGVGYYVWSKQKKSTPTSNSTKSSAAAAITASKEAEDACNKLYNDKDLCKFASFANLSSASYKATFSTKDKDGKSSSYEISQDGKGNSSSVIKEDGKESGAFILLNGDNYIKDAASNTWTKYPKSDAAAAATDPSKETKDLKVDFKDEASKTEVDRTTYKKLGKEKCGNANCFKYQIIDPTQPGTESIVWFGDKDYTLHKWSFKDKDGSTNVGEFTYTSVTISAPSPVKDAPAVPTQADIQKQIDAANAADTSGSGN